MTKDRLKELLRPIADGLFGKQRTVRAEGPRAEVRPAGVIVEDLCAIEEEDWCKYAFSREPLNGRFTDEQRLNLTRQAIACGRDWAGQIVKQYHTGDARRLAEQMGAVVDYPLMPQNTSRVLFAEFRDPNKIHVYMDGVNKGEALFEEPGVRRALGSQLDIAALLIAHELFHMVEERNKKEIWTRTYKIELWAPKPLHNRSSVGVLGEIAAMSFAKTLTGLRYSPYVMDAYLVYGYSPEAASALYEEMMSFVGRTPRGGGDPPALEA